MDTTGRPFNDGILCIGASMYVDDRDCQARDQFMALAGADVRLHDNIGLGRVVFDLSGRPAAGVSLTDFCPVRVDGSTISAVVI